MTTSHIHILISALFPHLPLKKTPCRRNVKSKGNGVAAEQEQQNRGQIRQIDESLSPFLSLHWIFYRPGSLSSREREWRRRRRKRRRRRRGRKEDTKRRGEQLGKRDVQGTGEIDLKAARLPSTTGHCHLDGALNSQRARYHQLSKNRRPGFKSECNKSKLPVAGRCNHPIQS